MVQCVQKYVCPACGELHDDDEEAFSCCTDPEELSPRAWLKEFLTAVNTQDNRATATPYYYDLRFNYQESGHQDHYCPVPHHGTIFFTEEAANAYIKANQHNLPKGTYAYLNWGGRNPELQKLLESIGLVVGVPYERK